MFAAADDHRLPDPVDRLLAYIDLRRSFLDWPIAAFSCVGGTTLQETWATHPGIRDALARCVTSGMDHVRPHLTAAFAVHPLQGVSADSLAQQVQVAVQGGIIMAKAFDDPQAARAAFDNLERYLRLLFNRPA
jgi:TetR/AcrR family transcriptional regulator, transcriptional repressor for nem operon